MSRIVPQLPNTPFTPNSILVSTSTGFAAGDLVYFNATNGSYGPIPNAAFTSVPVNIVQNAPIYGGSAFNSFFRAHGPIGNSATDVAIRGSNNSKGASAVLTNGNIVTTWGNLVNGRAVFQIKTPAGVIVVQPTFVSTTDTIVQGLGPFCQVIALTGGGFVVFYGSNNTSLMYAVYDNTGTVVTALQSGGFSANSSFSHATGVGLPNGKFLLARSNNGLQVEYRVFEANGTPTYSLSTAPTTARNGQSTVVAAVRSNNNVLIMYPSSASNRQFVYIVFDPTINSVITTANFNEPIGSTSSSYCGTTCLTNDTFVMAFLYQVNSPSTGTAAGMRLLPVGNVLGSDITVGLPTQQALYNVSFDTSYAINVKNLSSGGFICAWNDGGMSLNYKFFNSLGASLFGTTPGQLISFGVREYNDIDLLEYSGAVTISASSNSAANGKWWPYIQVSSSTYQPILSPTIQNTVGSVNVATGNYLPSSSTPSSATFLSATTVSSSVSVPLSSPTSFITPVSSLTSENCNSVMPATLTDGKYVVVYQTTASPITVTAVVLSSTGGVIQTINVGTGIGGVPRTAKVAAMSNGGFVVSFASDNNTAGSCVITSRVYSPSGSSYALTSTSTITDVYTFNTTNTLGVTGLAGNRFAVAYNQGSSYFPRIQVFTGAGALLQAAVGPNLPNFNDFDITTSAINGTDIIVQGFYGAAGGFYVVEFRESTAGNTWGNTGNFSLGGGVTTPGNTTRSLPNGGFVFANPGSNTQANLRLATSDMAGFIQSSGYTMQSANIAGFAVGVTGFGTILSLTSTSNNQVNIRVFNPSMAISPTLSGGTSNYSITGSATLVSTGNMNAGVAGGQGYQALLTWLGESTPVPRYAIINAYPFTENVSVVAGVTPTSPVPLQPNGFLLTGVAANTVAAAGSGNVITNGLAVLNSNYSAVAPASSFDFQNPALFGVKGTIVGRNVNLQGNN